MIVVADVAVVDVIVADVAAVDVVIVAVVDVVIAVVFDVIDVVIAAVEMLQELGNLAGQGFAAECPIADDRCGSHWPHTPGF